jgi:hypothetical protein
MSRLAACAILLVWMLSSCHAAHQGAAHQPRARRPLLEITQLRRDPVYRTAFLASPGWLCPECARSLGLDEKVCSESSPHVFELIDCMKSFYLLSVASKICDIADPPGANDTPANYSNDCMERVTYRGTPVMQGVGKAVVPK